ncbi:DUF411 domain-containing protein [Luteimonas vadosa]
MVALVFAVTACSQPPRSSSEAVAAAAGAEAAPRMDARETAMRSPPGVLIPASRDAALPHVVVHKSPTCGCCGAWVEHIRDAGFHVEVRESDDLEPVKSRLGVPFGKGSCHTAEIDGYFVEGHVPAEDIKRLLAERPDARGLTLPGMPIGSPGMESPDGTVQPYTVEVVSVDGTTHAYARHGPPAP